MKIAKNILALMLYACCINIALADIQYNKEGYILNIYDQVSMSDIKAWYAGNPEAYVGLFCSQGATIIMDDLKLPANTYYFSFAEGSTLAFDKIQEVEYDHEMNPQLNIGDMTDYSFPKGTLTVSVTDNALQNMLSGGDITNIVEGVLLSDCMFGEMPGSEVFLTLHDEKGNEINKGGSYTYNGQEYKNVGIIYDAGELQKNQIALLLRGERDSLGWGHGTFSIVALGEDYAPVPEPTTGSLSLLALAGLCARRRRK